MGDAAEVLTALYDKLASVAAKAGQASLLDDNFGLHVRVRDGNKHMIVIAAQTSFYWSVQRVYVVNSLPLKCSTWPSAAFCLP